MHTLRTTILAGAALGAFGLIGAASAQQTAPQPATPPAATTMPPAASAPRATQPTSVARPDQRNEIVAVAALERGANSFTEGQAKSRFEEAGFTEVTGLVKDEAGFWRARGMRGGLAVDLAMDFRGRIAAGPEVAILPRQAPSEPRAGTTPAPASSTR